MRYPLAAQLYWPTWLVFKAYDMTWFGMLAGITVVLIAWRVMWVIEFGEGDA